MDQNAVAREREMRSRKETSDRLKNVEDNVTKILAILTKMQAKLASKKEED
tara:strand:- start:10943 stop:11095 length:153 start_codon:yes stop_codon:yes gene_type:complete